MATLTVRNLDDEVVETLKERAQAHNRSLEAEVRQILKDAARLGDSFSLRTLAERIAAMTPSVPQTDSTELIREDRDTDHGRDL